MAREPRTRLEKLFGGPVPEDDQPVTTETQAIDAMRLATDNAALEHAVSDLTIRLRHAEHENDELRVNNELLTEENETLRRTVQELDKLAFPTMPLPDAIQRDLLLDLTDQPAPDTITGGQVELPGRNDFVTIVDSSKNGTA